MGCFPSCCSLHSEHYVRLSNVEVGHMTCRRLLVLAERTACLGISGMVEFLSDTGNMESYVQKTAQISMNSMSYRQI